MTDLKFDVTTMEMVIEDGDFVLSNELSEQNGGILLYCKNFNIDYPVAGVGLGLSVNSSVSYQQNLLNLWKSQCITDGAKNANFEQKKDINNNSYFETKIQY